MLQLYRAQLEPARHSVVLSCKLIPLPLKLRPYGDIEMYYYYIIRAKVYRLSVIKRPCGKAGSVSQCKNGLQFTKFGGM